MAQFMAYSIGSGVASAGVTEGSFAGVVRGRNGTTFQRPAAVSTMSRRPIKGSPTPYLCPVGEGAESGCGSHKGGKVPVSIGRRPE